MKEKVSRLAKGIFEYENPELIVSESVLYIDLTTESVKKGSFVLSNSRNELMKGVVYVSEGRCHISNPTFYGRQAEIHYEYRADATLSPEDYKEFEITVVSSIGEVTIPVKVIPQKPYLECEKGKVYTMDQFVLLARNDVSEAMKVFKNPDFAQVLLKKDFVARKQYECLLKSVSTSHALEEFLIAIHKKEAVKIAPDKTDYLFEQISETTKGTIKFTKNGWGYAEYKISSDVPFLIPEHKIVWMENFLGNDYELSYLIDPSKMHGGMNEGNIILESIHHKIEIHVMAERTRKTSYESVIRRKRKRNEVKMVKKYLQFRFMHITKSEYIKDMEKILHELISIEPETRTQLLQLHLMIVEENYVEAGHLLEVFELQQDQLLEESVLYYLGFLYLKALFTKKKEDIYVALQTTKEYYKQENNHWMFMWLILNLETGTEAKEVDRIEEIKKLYKANVHTPILYFEAFHEYLRQPSLLKELGEFEIQMMHFGIHYGGLTGELKDQFLFLVGRMKTLNTLLFHDLVALYEKEQDDNVLSAIIRFLIKEGRDGTEYFKWYERGVKKQLKITQLYEYYMYTVPEDENVIVPQSVLLYFWHNSHLPEAKKAFLLAEVIRQKETYPHIFEDYESQIKPFVNGQIAKKNISEQLAVLYEECLKTDEIEESLAAGLPAIIYRHCITCENPRMVKMGVIHEELKEEVTVPLVEGKAYVNIYTKNALIYFEDERGNRYFNTIAFNKTPLLAYEPLSKACYEHNKHDDYLLLHEFDQDDSFETEDIDRIYAKQHLVESSIVSDEYKKKGFTELIEYFFHYKNGQQLEEYLGTIDIKKVDGKQRTLVIEYYILCDLYEQAIQAITLFGFEQIHMERLNKLCKFVLQTAHPFMETECFCQICYKLLDNETKENEADDKIIAYLVEHYDGKTDAMYRLWKEAKRRKIVTTPLEDRLLGQMLFAETDFEKMEEIFISYVEQGKSKLLVRAFLSYAAYCYVVKDIPIQVRLFPLMKQESQHEYNEPCMIALMKYYSGCERDLSEEELNFIDYNVNDLIGKGKIFPFFKKFDGRIHLTESVLDKHYVEYKTDPHKRVFIHYIIDKSDEDVKYTVEEMKNVYSGIFVKDFLLFYNEVLQYYISEVDGTVEEVTKSGEETMVLKVDHETENRYNLMNTILHCLDDRNDEELLKHMKRYVQNDYAARTLFKPL